MGNLRLLRNRARYRNNGCVGFCRDLPPLVIHTRKHIPYPLQNREDRTDEKRTEIKFKPDDREPSGVPAFFPGKDMVFVRQVGRWDNGSSAGAVGATSGQGTTWGTSTSETLSDYFCMRVVQGEFRRAAR